MPELDGFEDRFRWAYQRYLDEAPAEMDARIVARVVAGAQARPAARLGLLRWTLRPARGLVWLVLLTVLIAAFVGATLFLGTHRPVLRDVGLTPTGIDVLTAEPADEAQLVADGKGVLWAREFGGRLVRFDPATESGRSWTISDDAAFTTSEIAAAQAGGVWLVTGRSVRWFDGTVFREVVEAPSEITVLTEAPDGTLWAATSEGIILHWDGASWARLDPGRPSSSDVITAIHVDVAGRTWVGWRHPEMLPASGWVSLYDGVRWTRLDASDAAPLGGAVLSIAESHDGAIWISSETGFARLRGATWTDETSEAHGGLILSMGADRDGAIWLAGSFVDGPMTVGRFDGDSWQWYGPSDGLPGDASVGGVAAAAQSVFVATTDGIIRRSNGQWDSVWPPAPVEPTGPAILMAVSRDELWARGDSGLWHYLDGIWSYEEVVPNPSEAPTVLTRAPDGTLWAGGTDGVAYRREGRWILADPGGASAIAIDPSGDVWVAGADARSIGKGGLELWTLRPEGPRWVRETVEGCPLESYGRPINSLAFDDNGALWVGISADPMAGWPGGLARFDGRSWEAFPTIAGSDLAGAIVLGTAPDGVWVAAHFPYVRSDGVGDIMTRAARFDGAEWKLVDMPDVPDRYWVRPRLGGGTLWASTPQGPARYDGKGWVFPYPGITLTAWTGGALGWQVAPDGSAFGYAGSSILRFPARE